MTADRDQTTLDDRLPLGWALAAVGLVGAVALLVRLAYGFEYAADPLGQYLWVDEGAYWTRAREIARGVWWPGGPFYQDPLWPYVLAILIKLRGDAPDQLRVMLAGLGALTPLAITWAGWRGIGRVEGIVAGLIAALYAPLIFTDGLLEKEGLGALLAALALGLTASGAKAMRGQGGWVAASGLAWGLLALVRANALLIGPVGAIAWAWGLGPSVHPTDRAGRWRRPLWFLVGFTAAVAPVAVVNRLAGPDREWIVPTSQGGANFYLGNGPDATGTYQAPDFVRGNPAFEADDFAAEAERRAGHRLSPASISRYWYGAGLQTWRDQPSRSVGLLIRKLGFVFHRFEIPDNQSAEVVRLVAAPSLGWGLIGWGTLLPLAMVGLAGVVCNRFVGFVAVVSVVGLGSTAVFFVVGRYRIPWVPGLTLLAAVGVVETFQCLRAGHWRRGASRGVILGGIGVALAWWPMADPVPDRWAHAEIELAVANIRAGRLTSALDALDDARALGIEPARHLANLLGGGPLRADLAALASGKPANLVGVAVELERSRRLRQFPEGRAASRTILDDLLRDHPTDPSILRESGAWWLGAIDDPSARDQARRAIMAAVSQSDADAAILATLMGESPIPQTPTTARSRLARAVALSRRQDWGVGSGL